MRPPSLALTVTLSLVAVGILAQAILAGYFISGVANLRLAHMIVGSALQWAAIVAAAIALVNRTNPGLSGTMRTWTYVLAVGLWLQSALGHMPFATATVVHVPLGALLLSGSIALAIASLRPTG